MTPILRLVLLLLLPILVFGQKQDLATLLLQCRQNEVQKCGSTCIETCTHTPNLCPAICKNGCFCADGYVRQSNATGSPCIKRADCKGVSDTLLKCGENEIYSICGSSCPPTCDDIRYPVPKPAKPCVALCRTGCFCKKGFYRAANGQCVPPQQCCGNNERYKTCGSACVETCKQKPVICTLQCVAGCFCGCSDYVRQNSTINSPCIHRDDCPPK